MDNDLFIALRKYPCTDDNETAVTVAEFFEQINERMEKRMEAIDKTCKPLTEEQIFELADTSLYEGGKNYGILQFARAIERAHGIGGGDAIPD